MGRYRPPQKPGSRYLTAQGERRLKAELHRLWRVERPQVTQSVSDAAALGDRSENAEYIYGKKRLREIDRRVRYLSKRLEECTVVSVAPSNPEKIYFGAFVELEDEDGKEYRYRVVGPDEIDPKLGYISMDAPLGKALLGKAIDDEVSAGSGEAAMRYYVTAISYDVDA